MFGFFHFKLKFSHGWVGFLALQIRNNLFPSSQNTYSTSPSLVYLFAYIAGWELIQTRTLKVCGLHNHFCFIIQRSHFCINNEKNGKTVLTNTRPCATHKTGYQVTIHPVWKDFSSSLFCASPFQQGNTLGFSPHNLTIF